jgi:hypothetical protein
MADLIGLCGFARSGKNSFADFIIDSCPKVRALSFAHALKKELQPFVFQQLGISTFTEDPKEKEMIRPLLVCWGTRIIREHIDKNYWVKKLTESVNNNRKNKIISIITDVRFINEIEWIHNEGGLSIFVEREGIIPKNADESKFTEPLKEKCNLIFTWKNLSNLQEEGGSLVKNFLQQHNLCSLTTPTKN